METLREILLWCIGVAVIMTLALFNAGCSDLFGPEPSEPIHIDNNSGSVVIGNQNQSAETLPPSPTPTPEPSE